MLSASNNSVNRDDIALLVSGSPAGVDACVLKELAARADFVLAIDAGAEQLAHANITPDLLVGDFDSLSQNTLAFFESEGVPLQSYDPYKNATDVELGVEVLSLRGYRRLVATNVLGGRTDHALGSLGALAWAAQSDAIEVALRDSKEVCYFVSSNASEKVLELHFEDGSGKGNHNLSSSLPGNGQNYLSQNTNALSTDESSNKLPSLLFQPMPRPRHVSLIAWGGPVTVSLQGAEWPLDHHALSPNSARGVSNILRSSVLRLEVHDGTGTALLLLSY